MKIINLVFILFILILINQCRWHHDEQSWEHFQLTLNQQVWDIHCYDSCDRCEGKYEIKPGVWSETEYLSKITYKAIYDECFDYLNKDITDTTNVTLFQVEFKPAPGDSNKYGYDSWRDNESSFYRENYLSLKAGDSTMFIVNLKFEANAYDSFVVEINFNTPDISFSNTFSLTKKRVYRGDNPIKIYSRYDYKKGTAEINVKTYSKNGEDCLTCDERFAEDRLKCVVYEGKTINNEKQKIYFINSPSITKDTSQWQSEITDIIKQAIVNFSVDTFIEITDNTWDLNSNGHLDVAEKGLLPSDKDEYTELLIRLEEENNCFNDIYGATIIVKGALRVHTYLTEDADAGETVLSFNHASYELLDEDVLLGPWLGGTSEYEWVEIIEVDTLADILVISGSGANNGLQYLHKKDESFWFDDIELGFTYASCGCMGDNVTFKTITHEMLHQTYLGGLEHVTDTTNLMYPYANISGNKLRYRELELYEDNFKTQQQWGKIQEAIK